MLGAAMALLGLATLALDPNWANAVDSTGRYAVRGIGQTSCSQFLRTLPSSPTMAQGVANWLAGYLSAMNRYERDTYDIAAWHDDLYLLELVRRTCARRPSLDVAAAAAEVGRSLQPSRVDAFSPVQSIAGSNGQTVRLYTVVIRRIQTALAGESLYTGPVDGAISARLLDAIGQFQRAHGLPVTGLPDQQTLFQLFNGAPAAPAVPGDAESR
ncbi:MAG: peptidoglycan-binding protein [Sphingomonadales bacterium]|nr:MAG: peptidoglycan-binding protein [Sphingomonadales bacterium]